MPLPTYVTAPVAPRATPDVDLAAPDAWSSARSSAVVPDGEDAVRATAPERDRPADRAEEGPAAHADERPQAPGR
ncbi:hypothetical protein G3I61_31690, partial [Streptomyces diastaticus]|nr:hypothetical protein [Streptomyces diastaticus]